MKGSCCRDESAIRPSSASTIAARNDASDLKDPLQAELWFAARRAETTLSTSASLNTQEPLGYLPSISSADEVRGPPPETSGQLAEYNAATILVEDFFPPLSATDPHQLELGKVPVIRVEPVTECCLSFVHG